jgi:hypothetical protein
MATTVTLSLYSGKPNPSWNLDDSQIGELSRKIHALTHTIPINPPETTEGLGYSGFTIDTARFQSLNSHIHIYAGVITLNHLETKVEKIPELEAWLLSTGTHVLDQKEIDYVKEEIL